MRDVTESAREDRQIVIGKGGATEPYTATHWVGQWDGAKPLAKPRRTDVSAVPGAREPPPERSNQRGKSSQAERARRRRRYIALASGVAAVALLLVVVIPDLDQPKPIQLARVGLAPSQVSNTGLPPSNADAAGAQGHASRIAEVPEPAIQRSQDGEPPVAISQELAEARRAIENLTAQLLIQATGNDHALAQERERTAALMQEAEAARKELTATREQHRQAIEQERASAAALASQLSASRQDSEALAAQLRKAVAEAGQPRQADAAKTAQSLEQEQKNATALTEAEAARRELTATTAQQRQMLEQERARGAMLTNQLSAARQEGEALTAQLRKAVSETAQIKQAETARNAEILQLEQQKVAALAEAEAARQALTATGAEQRRALEEERARGVALANQVSTVRQGNEALQAQLRKAQDEAGQSRQAAETTIAELRQTLQQERHRAAAMTSESRVARFGVFAPAATEPSAISEDSRLSQETAIVEAEQPLVAEAPVSQEAIRLIARASALLGQGDIGAARIVLERAVEMGSARASFMLAETYDPRILSAWGTYGTRGEVTRARELYAKAQAGGIPEAKDRVGALLQ